MSLTLITYLVYRAELDSQHRLVIQGDGSVWKLVARIADGLRELETSPFRDSALIQFTDTGVEYGKRYLWRVTAVDHLGNESLAFAQPGIQLRRHLDTVSLTGKILVGYQPSGGETVNWIYTLDPQAQGEVQEFSARWKPLDLAAQLIPELEQLYDLLVEDNRMPAKPVAAAIAHGGSGKEHLSQTQIGPVVQGGAVLDTFSFPADWRSWQSRFGQNLPESFYRASGVPVPWRVEITLAPALMPSEGDKLIFWDHELVFSAAGWGAGCNKIRLFAADPYDGSLMVMNQLAAIAQAIGEGASPALPLKAWVEPGSARLVIETVGAVSSTPQNIYRPVGASALVVKLVQELVYKTPGPTGAPDTDLTTYGEGSGQGFYRKMSDRAMGHLHLRVDWMDVQAERGKRFVRGMILVDGRFLADYVPGSSSTGIVDYLVNSDAIAGRILPADGRSQVVVEVRKYHASGRYVQAMVAKVCPKRTPVRRQQALRLQNEVELDLLYNPWDGVMELTQSLDGGWLGEPPAGWRPRFVSREIYAPAACFSVAGAVLPQDDYYLAGKPHTDLGTISLPGGVLRLGTGTLAQALADPMPSLTSLALKVTDLQRVTLTQRGMDLAHVGQLWMRSALYDGWGLLATGLFPADGSVPGNASLWSLPLQVPAVELFTWIVEARGTETYIADAAADDPDVADDPLAKRQPAVLASRAWQASSMGVMEGWRQRPQDESQNCLIVIGAGRQVGSKDLTRSVRYIPRMKQALARRPSRATVSVKVESLACRDWGDDPLLADGQEWDGDSPRRHEVATYLPRTSESPTPFLIHLQPLLESRHVFAPGQAQIPDDAYSLDLDAGRYELRYGSGWAWRGAADDACPVHLSLFMALPGGQPQRLLSDSYASLRQLMDAIDGGKYRQPLANLELSSFGWVRLWCELSGEQVSASISLLVTGKGSRRAAIERPVLPYVINDFLNYDDAEAPWGRSLSGAPREWPDADDPGLPGGAGQWHDADYADAVPAGSYPLTPAVILPEKDGYELELVAHAFRSDIGHRIQVGSAPAVSIGEPDQVTEVDQGQSFRLLLPPLVPVTPQDFSKEVSGWGLGNAKVANRTFTAVADPRIAPGGSCRGLITNSVGMLVSSELRPGQTAFSRIVIGTPHFDFRLYWLDRSSGVFDPLPSLVPVPLGLSREGRSLLWVNDYLLPTTSPLRLGIAFPAAAGQECSVYGVWLIDEAPAWQVLVEKDGAPWNGATGSAAWTDIGALAAGKAMSRPSLHSLLLDASLPKGSYRFRLLAQTISSTLRQSFGNYLCHELAGDDGATETNQGTEVQIQVKVN